MNQSTTCRPKNPVDVRRSKDADACGRKFFGEYFITTLFFYKNVVFPAQDEYSYFSDDFRLKIFLYYS